MEPQNKSLLRRGFTSLLRVSLTGSIAVGAVIAAITGTSVLAARNAAEVGSAAAPPTPVQAAPISLERSYSVERRFSGVFEGAQETNLAFELAGTITELLVEEGDEVAAGQVVARLDTRLLLQERRRLEAARAGLEAEAELARRTNARQEELKERGFASAQRVDDTSLGLLRVEAAIAETDAAIASVDVRLAKSEITAPFKGRISARLADAGSASAPGLTVLRLLEDAPNRFRVGFAPDVAAGLKVGDRAIIDAASGPFDAELTHLAPRLDDITRAQTAFFTTVSGAAPAAGATGEILLEATIETDFSGAWLPLDALRQGPKGSWTVLTINGTDEAPTVGIAAVELIHVETGRAFVRGTFGPEDLLIDTGAHRVVPGQPVTLLETEEVLSWAR